MIDYNQYQEIYNDAIDKTEQFSHGNRSRYSDDTLTSVADALSHEYNISYSDARGFAQLALGELLHNPLSETFKRAVKGWSKYEHGINGNFSLNPNVITKLFIQKEHLSDFYEWTNEIVVIELIYVTENVNSNQLLVVVNGIKLLVRYMNISVDDAKSKFEQYLHEYIVDDINEVLSDFVNEHDLTVAESAINLWTNGIVNIILSEMFASSGLTNILSMLTNTQMYLRSCINNMVNPNIIAIDKEYIENIILVKINEALIRLLSVTLDGIISYMINIYYNPMTMMKIVSVVIDMIEYLY